MNILPSLAASCLALCLPLQAAESFHPIELHDQELAQLRGRYVLPGRIISFGIVMSSTWTNAAGQSIGARTSLQIQQSTLKPQFYVTALSSAGNGSTPAAASGSISGGAGLAQTQGVTQSTRSAGDYNSASNAVGISVSEADQVSPSTPQGTPLNAGFSASNAAGTVSVTPGNGSIRLAIDANGQGSSLQQLAAGGLRQATDLLGSSNLVSNQTQLSVVLRNNLPTVGALDCNLTQLKGLRQMGM